MSDKRFVCIDVGYGDDWYITDNGKRLSEMEIVDLLNEQQATIEQLQDLCGESDGENAKLRIENKRLEEENEQLKSARRDDAKEFSALFRQNFGLKRRLDYEKRMHKRWKDDCLAILEEQDLIDYVGELQKNKKSGWDSEPNTDYVTKVKEGLK